MITLLHGDYIEASRNELARLKEKAGSKEVRIIDGRNVELSALTQSLESSSLFGGDLLVIIERLFGRIGKFPKKIEEIASIIAKNGGQVDVVLWEDKEVGSTVVKHLGKDVHVRLFKLPVLVFQLLDGLRSGNAKQLLQLFEQMKDQDAPELIFAMLVKRMRQMIQISDGTTPEGVAPWQLSRLTTQTKSFKLNQLLSLYTQLHTVEVSIKTGMSPYTMAQHIEQFFISL